MHDDLTEADLQPQATHPYGKMGWLGRLFFRWIDPVIEAGRKQELQPSDLYKLNPAKSSLFLTEQARAYMATGMSPFKACFRVVRSLYIEGCIYYVLASVLQLAAPLFVQECSKVLENKLKTVGDEEVLWIYTGLLVVALFARSLLLNHAHLNLKGSGARCVTMMRTLIHDKLQRVEINVLQGLEESVLVNLLTVDLDNLIGGLMIIPNLISSITLLGLQFYFFRTLPWYTLILLVSLVLPLPFILKKIHFRTTKTKQKLLSSVDQRASQVRELHRGAVQIKLEALEGVLLKKWVRTKANESHELSRYFFWTYMASTLSYLFPNLFGLVAFGTGLIFGAEKPSSSNTANILTILAIMKLPISNLNDAFDDYPEFKASHRRVSKILLELPEKPTNPNKVDGLQDGEILIKQASFVFSVDKHEEREALKNPIGVPLTERGPLLSSQDEKEKNRQITESLENINLHIKPGMNVAIVGAKNSGKSFLILSILGETKLLSGDCGVKGSIAYLSHEGFFVEASIKENILLTRPMNEKRFEMAVRLFNLHLFTDKIVGGLDFVVKDNGVNINNSVKKRLLLARLFYSEADIYIIDGFLDSLSWDLKTTVFSSFLNGIAKGKTALIATREPGSCSLSDQVILMKDRRIVTTGHFQDLSVDTAGLFYQMMPKDNLDTLGARGTSKPRRTYIPDVFVQERLHLNQAMLGDENPQHVHPERHSHKLKSIMVQMKNPVGDLPIHSPINTHTVLHARQSREWRLMGRQFFFSKGYFLPLLLVLLTFLAQLLIYLFYWYTAQWKSKTLGFPTIYYLYFYLAIFGGTLLVQVLSKWLLTIYFRQISLRLYTHLARSLLGEELDFFRRVSLSQLLGLLVYDYTNVEQKLGPQLVNLLQVVVRIHVGVAVLMSSALSTIPVFVMYVLYVWWVWKYLSPNWGVKHVLATLKTHFLCTAMDSLNSALFSRSAGLAIRQSGERYFHSNDLYQNVRGFEGDLFLRWLAMRVYLLSLFFPVIVLLDLSLQTYFRWNPSIIWTAVRFSVSFDLCFSAFPLVSSLAKGTACLADLQRVLLVAVHPHPHSHRSKLVPESLAPVEPGQKGWISLERVHLFDPLTASTLLDGLTLRVAAGEFITLTGPPGSGKHSVLELLANIYPRSDLTDGQVTIGGRHLPTPPGTVHYLSPSNILIGNTVREVWDPLGIHSSSALLSVVDYLGLRQHLNRQSLGLRLWEEEGAGSPLRLKDMPSLDSQAGVDGESRSSLLPPLKPRTRRLRVRGRPPKMMARGGGCEREGDWGERPWLSTYQHIQRLLQLPRAESIYRSPKQGRGKRSFTEGRSRQSSQTIRPREELEEEKVVPRHCTVRLRTVSLRVGLSMPFRELLPRRQMSNFPKAPRQMGMHFHSWGGSLPEETFAARLGKPLSEGDYSYMKNESLRSYLPFPQEEVNSIDSLCSPNSPRFTPKVEAPTTFLFPLMGLENTRKEEMLQKDQSVCSVGVSAAKKPAKSDGGFSAQLSVGCSEPVKPLVLSTSPVDPVDEELLDGKLPRPLPLVLVRLLLLGKALLSRAPLLLVAHEFLLVEGLEERQLWALLRANRHHKTILATQIHFTGGADREIRLDAGHRFKTPQ